MSLPAQCLTEGDAWGAIVSAVKFKSLHKDHPTALTVSNVGLKQLKFANDFKSSLGLAHSLNS
ncbi:MAG: hypothetical protein IJ228_03810, partial [Succinivibrio sp.]|nr:hypothetical protein [Succinivibrio sp.]